MRFCPFSPEDRSRLRGLSALTADALGVNVTVLPNNTAVALTPRGIGPNILVEKFVEDGAMHYVVSGRGQELHDSITGAIERALFVATDRHIREISREACQAIQASDRPRDQWLDEIALAITDSGFLGRHHSAKVYPATEDEIAFLQVGDFALSLDSEARTWEIGTWGANIDLVGGHYERTYTSLDRIHEVSIGSAIVQLLARHREKVCGDIMRAHAAVEMYADAYKELGITSDQKLTASAVPGL